jgi:hypothetical protein
VGFGLISPSQGGMEFMKILVLFVLMLSHHAQAQSSCDIKLGRSAGVRVVEFATNHVVHSKIALKEMSVQSLQEEMLSLQEMGICQERIQRKRCVLKYEKLPSKNQLTMYRGSDRWPTWNLNAKNSAQKFVRILQLAGFCL